MHFWGTPESMQAVHARVWVMYLDGKKGEGVVNEVRSIWRRGRERMDVLKVKVALCVCFLDHSDDVVEPGALEGRRGDICEAAFSDLGKWLEEAVVPVFLAESNLVDDHRPGVVASARLYGSRPRCDGVDARDGVLNGVHPLVVAYNLDAVVPRLLDELCGPEPVDDGPAGLMEKTDLGLMGRDCCQPPGRGPDRP